jgi:predicted ATPase/DNA-binding winged helix-turn-helix (wHTH) protein
VVFEFGGYQLDDDRVALTGPDGVIHCEPQVFRVLVHLVQNRHRVVPKEELLDVVWGDRFVSESALTSRLKAARRAVGDTGHEQHTIKTVHGVGYHFVAEVRSVTTTEAPPPPASRAFPAPRSDLIGREADLAGVLRTVGAARVTTIVGTGGVGKTSLALAAGQRLWDDFGDGAIFVDLTAAGSADDVTRTLADTAGVEGAASRSSEQLASHLGGRRMLIVFDNCEHVVGPVSEMVGRLLASGAEARVLATSREPLAVPGEHLWPLEPLDAAAPALFVERARAVDPRRRWDPDDPEIVDVCQRLDGLPLALELAAGQLRRWGFGELSRQLRTGLSPLARAAHGFGSRHATMAAAIDWSYQLLDPSERRLLRNLSVFPSTFEIRSVEAVAAGLPDVTMPATLGELVDKSLVVRDAASERFRLLETIRAFARDRLDDAGETDHAVEGLRRHVVDRARATTRLDRWLSAALAAAWRVDGEQARQAFWASLVGGHDADAVEIAVARAFLWRNAIGCAEGGAWIEQLLARELSPGDRIWALILLADLGQGIGDFHQMLAAAEGASACDDGSDAAASCIIAHFRALAHLTDQTSGRAHFERVRAMAPDPRLAGVMDAFMIVPDIPAGDRDEIARRIDLLNGAASDDGYDRFITHWVGWMFALAQRDADETWRWMHRQLEFLGRTGIVETWLSSLSGAMTASVDGRDVRDLVARALALADREGYRADADCALALAYSEACRGDAEAAAEWLGTAIGSRFNSTAHYTLYRVVVEPVVHRQLEPAALAAAVERGRRRTAEEALAELGID